MMKAVMAILMLLALSACVIRKPILALYCDQKSPDGKHCQQWAPHVPYECVHNQFGDCTADTR